MFGGAFPEPREFQSQAIEDLRQGIREGHQNQLLVAPTGSGKTYIGMKVVSDALAKFRRALFLCDRRTLLAQTSDVAESYGLWNHSVIAPGSKRLDLHKLFQIASTQTLASRGWVEADVIIVDECFPGATLVETLDGPCQIGQIKPGQMVFTACGSGVVRSVFSKTAARLVRLRISDGTSIECTPDHPVFTGLGWRPAGALAKGTRLFRLQDMPRLWGGVPPLHPQDGCACGIPGDRGGLLDPSLLREILREEAEESDAQSFGAGEGLGDLQAEGDRPAEALGQREGDDAGAGPAPVLHGVGLGGRVCGEDTAEEERRLAARLQVGPGEPGAEGGRRGGWQFAPLAETEAPGRAQGCAAELPWVEGVETVERPGGIPVFNLRVAGHPSYFAAGVLVHNCHTRYKTWVDRITSKDCHAKVIGLSATPFTKGLGKVFTRCVNAATMARLVGEGTLVPMRVFSCRRPDMRGAETRGGEWTDAAAEKAEVKLVGDVVTEWHRHAYGLKTIGFGATVAHCEELRRQFQASGVRAELYVGETKEDERTALMDAFRPHDGELRVLLTVEALAKGFDMRDVECVIDARPLQKSLSTAIQMWGRGLRSSPETGKTECLLLDFSGNIIRFADDFSDFYYNGVSALDTHAERLDREVRKDEEKEAKACPECGFKPVGRKCIQCGWEKPRKSLVESAPGVMEEIVIAGKSAAKDCAHLWAQLATYALSTSRPGKDPRKRAMCLYKDFTGKWPPRAWGLDVPACAPTPATRNKIRALAIAFAHRREASHA